ncbi:MAG: methylated-DNA--[protein]-cysteine S-methyltransferase [Gemmatimonadetes bacterium]|nr:methylated-DNA--[protein]-cysteine S-methyltransferase [Gemmatimonadota bacterium]
MPTPVAQAELAARARGDAEPEVRSSHWDEARAISRRRAGDALVDAATVTATSPALRILDDTRAQLDRYFAGRLRTFDLPLAPQGTDFQRRVWTALTQIPFGTTTSYGAVARTIGLPEAVRAVGAANGQNPIPVIIPCHRVIGANGTLTGFGGGLPRKRFLLALERGDDLALAL